MRLTKRQLKRIIKEEYTKLVKAGFITEGEEEEADVGDEGQKLEEADNEDEDEEAIDAADIKEAIKRANLRKIIRKNTTNKRRSR